MPKKNSTQAPSFEQLYTELEATIESLEAGNLSLDQALSLYERGMDLAKQCAAMLDRAELRIQELAPTMDEMSADEDFELLGGDEDA
jgi:exodeoxyribonuclease VII small subunit